MPDKNSKDMPDKNSKELLTKLPGKHPEIPEEIKKKFEELKGKLDKFKKQVLEKFEEYIVGIALLPPKKEEKKKPKKINVLVLVDDSDSKKMSRMELKDKLTNVIQKIAEDTDKELNPETMLLSELKESCFDGKYEVLGLIATCAPVYDKGLLKALKVAEVHKTMAIKKFEKYVISYVAVGSLFRGDADPKDIDIAVIVDDTDVKKMSRMELKDKLRAIIQGMGFEASKMTGVEASFHVQTYILTDFWESVKDAHPVIFTFLRDGVPLYDRGVFMPWKLLLKMGRIKPSPEAIDMHREVSEKLLERVKFKLLSVIGEDLYYATLNPAQAALMMYGIAPPTPKETVKLLEEIFVKKEKLLEKKYVNILEKIRKTYKDIEHQRLKSITGKEIDSLLSDVNDFLKRLDKLFKEIEKRAEERTIVEIHDACMAVTKDVLKSLNVTKDKNLVDLFREEVVDKNKLPENFLKILKDVVKAKKDYDLGKLAKYETSKIRKEANIFIKTMIEFIQRSKGLKLEKSKLVVKYKDKIGELLFLDNKVFIVLDVSKREEISEGLLTEDGMITDIKKSSLESLEKAVSEAKFIERNFLKETTFESLKNIFGEDVQILIGG